jgi:hypothetical protein
VVKCTNKKFLRGCCIVIKKVIFILIFLFASWLFYRFGQFDSKLALEHQLKQIIQTQDKEKIISLSMDETTKDYLLQLPQNTDVHDTTDFQGGDRHFGYFVTTVGNRHFQVYMSQDTESTIHKLFPKWTLFKVSIVSLPPIPELIKGD